MPNHSGGLWISLHTLLHLLQTCPYWLPKSEQKVNSKIHGTTCGFLSLGWERARFSPKPAEPRARFHQPQCSHHSTSSFNLSALTKRQTLRKFYIWTDKKMKHLRVSQDCGFPIHLQTKTQHATSGWAGTALWAPRTTSAPRDPGKLQGAQAAVRHAQRFNTLLHPKLPKW